LAAPNEQVSGQLVLKEDETFVTTNPEGDIPLGQSLGLCYRDMFDGRGFRRERRGTIPHFCQTILGLYPEARHNSASLRPTCSPVSSRCL
jgi:hypothetical protein